MVRIYNSLGVHTLRPFDEYSSGTTPTQTGYVHPPTHPASMIVESQYRQFVTQAEKDLWSTLALDNMRKSIYDPDDDGKVISSETSDFALSVMWDSIIGRPISSQTNIDDAVTKRHTHINQISLDLIDKDVNNNPLWNGSPWPGSTINYSDIMYKTTFDSNGDGIVDRAEKVDWSGVENKPALFPPISHTHNAIEIAQDNTHRFVTDTQITLWSEKQDKLSFTPENVSNKGIANGYASLDINGKVPISQLPSDLKECVVVNNITERNNIAIKYDGMHVLVKDATDDVEAGPGLAEYIWDGMSWFLSAGKEYNLDLNWDSIQNKPSSTVQQIDDTVLNSHTHSNKNVLDSLTMTVITDSHKHNNQNSLDSIDNTLLDKIHEHNNKQSLDNLTQQIIDDSHKHLNSSILDNVTQSVLDNSHIHNNKSVLDNLTQSVIDNSHIHTNKTQLDLIDQIFINNNHNHTNVNTLNKITESNGEPLWNGNPWPGGSGSGTGDMLKASYDVDDDGIVDSAEYAINTHWAGVLDKPTSLVADIDDTVAKKHEHSNKAILDSIISENIHTHSNKTLLDSYSFTNNDVDDLILNKHTHSNKNILDAYDIPNSTLTDTVSKTHDHANKSALDNLTQSVITNSHTHANANTLSQLSHSTNIEGTRLTFGGVPIICDVSKHNSSHTPGSADALPTGTPGVSSPGDIASEGVQALFARADHTHARESFTSTITTINSTGSIGTENTLSRGDHTHALGTHTHKDVNNGGKISYLDLNDIPTSFIANPHTHITTEITDLDLTKFVRNDTDGNINGSLTINTNLTVGSALNINGSILKLNSNVTGTPSQNMQITCERGTLYDSFILWNELDDKWYINDNTGIPREILHTGNITNLPSTPHDHNDLYYTKAETDLKDLFELNADGDIMPRA